MATPESKVKSEVKKVIANYKSMIDEYWPVPSGYGESHLDCILCVNGFYVSIETKKPGGKPTPRQKFRINTVQRANGYALVIDGTQSTTTYTDLDKLLAKLCAVQNDKVCDERS